MAVGAALRRPDRYEAAMARFAVASSDREAAATSRRRSEALAAAAAANRREEIEAMAIALSSAREKRRLAGRLHQAEHQLAIDGLARRGMLLIDRSVAETRRSRGSIVARVCSGVLSAMRSAVVTARAACRRPAIFHPPKSRPAIRGYWAAPKSLLVKRGARIDGQARREGMRRRVPLLADDFSSSASRRPPTSRASAAQRADDMKYRRRSPASKIAIRCSGAGK